MNEEEARKEHAKCREDVIKRINDIELKFYILKTIIGETDGDFGITGDVKILKQDMATMKKFYYMAIGIIVFVQPFAYVLFQKYIQ